METENQIAVKKRLIYAEDLFEPVDFKVLRVGGQSSGKTMSMYEMLFRKRVELAPTIDAVEVVRCKDCKHCRVASWGERYCIRDKTVEWGDLKEDDFCSYGERRKGE